MTNKTIPSNGYQFTNESVRLDFGMLTDSDIFLNFNKWPNKAIVFNGTSV